MTCAQALAIAAATLVFSEPSLPLHAYQRAHAAVSRLETHALRRLQPFDFRAAALPDRHCMSRRKLLL